MVQKVPGRAAKEKRRSVVTKPECEAKELEKERILLSDGRELIFYRFPQAPKRPAPPQPAAAPAKEP
jgi:hypothetical protein